MNTMAMLIRREFWEHRMLVFAPLALCVIYLMLCVLAGANFKFNLPIFPDGVTATGPMPPIFYFIMNIMFTATLYGLMAIVAFFYLCDALYAERRDRSILFWKSLPVSDTMTVLSKLLVALIVVPLVVYVLALATNILAFLVFKVAVGFSVPRDPLPGGASVTWLKINGYLLMDVFILALWFAPVAAYQLLMSVAVPRAVFVWTVLPPVALIFGQRIFFDSWSIRDLVIHRLGGVMSNLDGPDGETLQTAFNGINGLPLLSRPDMWIGVAIAAALVFAAIRIRRYRGDS
jgi:ABC-2 type transport system permease protein